MDLAASAGLQLDPWQRLVLEGSLGEVQRKRWSAFHVALVVPRQNGKGSILEARELAGLFLFDERLIIHSAHEQATASEHFLRMLELIAGSPELSKQCLKPVYGKGSEAIRLKNGQRMFFKTRTAGGGRGLTGDLVVLDEAMMLSDPQFNALMPTMAAKSKVGNPQIWYTGSAVDREDPKHDGAPFARARSRALAGRPRRALFEWSLDAEHPDHVSEEMASDPESWAATNPGLEIRITPQYIEDERDGMGARGFAVERLSVGDWPSDAGDEADGITREMWLGCQETASADRVRKDTVVFSADVTPNRGSAAISGAGWRDDGLAHVETVAHNRGTDWVVPRAKDLQDQHGGVFIVDERGPSATLVQPLRDAGVQVRTIGGREMADGAGMIFDALAQRVVRHGGTSELTAAALGAAQRPLGDAWAWSRKTSTVDISPLVSVTLAYWGLRNGGSSVYSDRGVTVI